MLQEVVHHHTQGDGWTPSFDGRSGTSSNGALRLEQLVGRLPVQRRIVRPRQCVFRAGQSRTSLFLVHAGVFKTSVVSEDGREKITGFRMRGDLLGMDALDLQAYACDAVSLDVGEVWELSPGLLHDDPAMRQFLTERLAAEIRRDWGWMLALGTLGAEQRVASFLIDLASRLGALGFSESEFLLRMTRAEMGNFLALQLETVTRALSRLQARGLIGVDGRQIRIEDAAGLRGVLHAEAQLH